MIVLLPKAYKGKFNFTSLTIILLFIFDGVVCDVLSLTTSILVMCIFIPYGIMLLVNAHVLVVDNQLIASFLINLIQTDLKILIKDDFILFIHLIKNQICHARIDSTR